MRPFQTKRREIGVRLASGAGTDPLTFVATTILVAISGILAGFIPSRRATRVHPMSVLREE